MVVFGLALVVTLLGAACSPRPSTGGPVAEESPAKGELSLTWAIQEIGEGIKPAFALDHNGVVHTAFLTEEDHGAVFYASNASGTFEVETVAEGYFYGPVDIAATAEGVPFIAYHDHQDTAFKPELGDEVVASPRESGWELVVVADEGHDGWDNSIVIDADGNWHTIRVVQVGSGPVDYEFGTSIQLGKDGSPGIVYFDTEEEQLEYARLGSSGWSVEVVDGEGDAGRYPSLAYDPQGNPHIAYYVALSDTSGLVRHAWREGRAWQVEDVDALDDIRMGRVGARKITALAISQAGVLHLAYADRGRVV